jgi:pimeloyl-ACP methyl ester carboxylesterase
MSCLGAEDDSLRSSVVQHGPYRIEVMTRGRIGAPAAIILPGLGGGAYTLAPQVRLLRCLGYTTHVIGLPGFGLGPLLRTEDARFEQLADLVIAAANALAIRHALVLGHSLGGGVALYVALREPEVVSRLALLAPAAVGCSLSWMYRLFSLPLLGRALLRPHARGDARLLRRFGLGRLRRDDRRFVDTLARLDRCSPECARSTRAVVSANAPRGWRRVRALVMPGGEQDAFTLRARLGELRHIPTLALWGADDRIISAADTHYLRAGHPYAEIHIAPGIGHMLPLEAPEWTDRHLAGFAARTAAAAGVAA